jgi:curved DNA-binding protein CbpA
MPMADDHLAELKHGYRVLDVPLAASTSTIKQAYRNLIKRWHPDLYPNGTPEYAEATQMTKLINEAYAAVEDAPLRYHVDACPPDYVRRWQAANPSSGIAPGTYSVTPPKTDWLEFTIRFICGAFFGALLSVRAFFLQFSEPATFIPVAITLILICGFAAAFAGDNFWHSVLRRWWMWW